MFLLCPLYISYNTDKNNLFHNQKLLQLIIISINLTNLLIHSGGGYCIEKLDTGLLGITGLHNHNNNHTNVQLIKN